MQALKTNGGGEFEDALRDVVKCIYSPSKYYTKVMQTADSVSFFFFFAPKKQTLDSVSEVDGL